MFRNFFIGRYGMDKLNIVLVYTALLLSIITMFLSAVPVVYYIISGISTVLLVIALFRMFSRNFARRQAELSKYFTFENRLRGAFSGIRGGFSRMKTAVRNRKTYKYLTCPQCMQKLRVPRGKGRLRVTCTKCGHKFETRS